MLLRARLDRIDRHVDGRIRILDYKTTDAGSSPRETHYQPRNKAWADLQLPLYRYLYEQLYPSAAAGSRPPPPPDGSRPPPPCAEGEPRAASGEHRPPPQITVGYFNLPKAATDTRIEMFDLHPKDDDLYPSALAAARTVIAAIRAGQFWPPAQLRPDRDDFALLFAGGAGLIQEPPA
jgi:ATP-dependent helicase/nuclease subunit B